LKLSKKHYFFIYFLYFSLTLNSFFLKSENINKETIQYSHQKNEDFSGERYILGPGDILNINFLEVEDFSGNYPIMSDGALSLPIIGLVDANYLTIEKLTKKLKILYSKELIRPELFISLKKGRPINISLIGEINRPGLYKLSVNTNPSKDTSSEFVNLPTIVDAISKAGGITPKSNIKSVSVKRRLSDEKTKYKKIDINLVNLLMKGDQSQNLILFDGDIITIKEVSKSENLSKETLKIAKGNLSPRMININVIGAVEKPGEYNVKSNTTLNKAILLANGFTPWKANRTNIQLYRIKNNGSISTKKYKFNINEEVSESKNPPLKDGDIVKVNTTSASKISGGIKEITSPFTDILSPYYLFKLISD